MHASDFFKVLDAASVASQEAGVKEGCVKLEHLRDHLNSGAWESLMNESSVITKVFKHALLKDEEGGMADDEISVANL